jgi:Zn-dependent protease/predicted transcriptional regulator
MVSSSFRLPFRVFGIPIRLDVTFLLLIALLTWLIGGRVGTYIELFDLPLDPVPLQRGATPWLLGLASALGLMVSVLIHELAHALTARRFGVEIKEIRLWILGGIAQFERMPRQPSAEALVAIVGPLTSALLGLLLWWTSGLLGAGAGAVLVVVSYLAAVNLLLAAFNLLPALPMDGGRVLRALLATRMDHLRATRIAAGISQVLAVLMGLLGLATFNLFLVAIAFFVYLAVQAETQHAAITRALRDITVDQLMSDHVETVDADMPVETFVRFMLRSKHVFYPVVSAANEVVGIVRLDHVQDAPEGATVGDVMSAGADYVDATTSAVDAFDRIQRSEGRRLLVRDAAGRMVGVISTTDLLRAVQIRLAGGEIES